MPDYLVFNCDDLLTTSTPVGIYGTHEWDDALQYADEIKGYVVLRTPMRDCVIWASPRLDVYRLMAAMVRSFDPASKDHLRERVDVIKGLIRTHRMSEVA